MSKTIVIIGAGFFGVSTANRLAKNANGYKVKLISKSNFTYFLVASIRVPVYNKPDGTLIPLKDLLDPSIEVINDEVIDFDSNTVQLKSNDILEFDSLIIATGSKWPEPIGTTHQFGDNYKEYFDKQHEKLENAKHIVLVGGGFNNVELGGELFDKYEDEIKAGKKKVTLVHSSDKLLPSDGTYGDNLRQKVTNFYKTQTNFDIILNTKATYSELEDGTYEVNLGGEKVHADVLYHNVGVIPSVPSNSVESLTDEKGFIKVKDTFQVEAFKAGNIFAIGDVINFKFKGIQFRGDWMNIMCANIDTVLNRSNAALRNVIKPSGQLTALVSVGKRHGFGQFKAPYCQNAISIPSFAVILFKSKYLGVPFAKYILGNS